MAKRRLGQNFLRDTAVIARIIESLDLTPQDIVVEIGCGTGSLTRGLMGKVSQFIGVELDTALCQRLKNEYSSENTLFLNQDILGLDVEALLRSLHVDSRKAKVVGNLPYYISSPIVEWLGRQTAVIHSATVMFQSEVAYRLLAAPGNKEYGVLTLLAEYHFFSKWLLDVKPGAFRPIPKVHSTLIKLIPKVERLLDARVEPAFFRFLKQSFSQRRKTLRNSLKGTVESDRLHSVLSLLGHRLDSRAEVLSLEDFVVLFKQLSDSSV